MRVRFTATALSHLRAIKANSSERFNAQTAGRTLRKIRIAIDGLAQFPKSGRPGRVANTRELVVLKSPFIVAYEVGEDEILVLAVLHHARRWPDAL